MAKKDFKQNVAETFISAAEAPADPAQQELVIPRGYRLAPEPKSIRLQLLVKPTTKAGIKEAAAANGQSMNDLINSILEDYLNKL